jgi:outer membrane protein insertion porin family
MGDSGRTMRYSAIAISGKARGIFAAWLLAGASLPAAVGPAGAEPAIRVEGNQRIEEASIRTYFHAASGRQLEAADLDAALKALYATGLFADVRIQRSGDQVIVVVVENPTLGRVGLEGNRKIKEAQLKIDIRSKSGGPLWRPLVQEDVARMVDIYHRSGFFQARVEPKIIARSDRQTDLVFEIEEGAKTGVKQIRFWGNQAYSSDQLKGAIKTGETNFLSFLLNNDVYDPDRVEADRDLLRRYYLKHGYANIRIEAARPQYDPEQKGIVLTFTVEEGSQYRIGTVELRSNLRELDPAMLRARLRPDAGDVYNAETVQKTLEDLSIAAASHGFPFVAVQPRENRDPARHIVDLVYAVEPGPRRYVERINIRGNRKTQDFVIRREFDLSEGDAFNPALIGRAERRLRNLGYFKTVKIGNAPGSAADRIVIDVELEEQDTGDYSVAIGYSMTDGVVGQASIGDRNLLGSGDALAAAVTYGQYTKGFNLSFTQPQINGSGLAAGIDLFGKQSLASDYQSYGSESYGSTFRLGTALTPDLGVQWHYSIYNQSTSLSPRLDGLLARQPASRLLCQRRSIAVKQAVVNGPAWVSAVGSTVNYNTLDNNRSPTAGVASALNQDMAGLGGDVKFLRTTEDFRAYQPVAGDVVGMVRAQGGYVTPWGGQPLPLANGFFGGPQLVRGFAQNGFGPRDLTPGTTMDNVGGRQYWATSAELQAPVPVVPAGSGLKFGLFADAGSVWGYRGTNSLSGSGPALSQSLQVADSHVIRSSLGAGLIWDSPFGPIRADYAIPMSKASYDVAQRFRFSAGGF